MGEPCALAPIEPSLAGVADVTNVLFVNSGILGMVSFSKVIREAMKGDPEMEGSHIDLSARLTIDERIIRRLMCTRLWRDGLFGLKNMDLQRMRCEYQTGFQASRRIRELMGKKPIDVLHFHRQGTAFGSLRLMARVPSIVSIDATQDIMIDAATSPLEKWSYAPNAQMDGRVFRAAKAIVAASRWAADCLHRRYPDCGTPVHVMPVPVLLRSFESRWIEERWTRARVPGYRPKVVFVGDDFIRKGGEDLLLAWREGRLHELATLDIVTNGPVPPPDMPGVSILRDVAAYSPEWSDIWRSADVFVLPSRQEAFGTVLQEAAAAGLPRIATRINAIPEIVQDGRNGILVTPGDRGELVGALRRLIVSSDVRREFGYDGRRTIEQAGPEAYVSKLRAIVGSIAARPA